MAFDLDAKCSQHFHFRDLVECGETFARISGVVDNVPKRPETWLALASLATVILDPIVDEFGPLELTYGFSSSRLARRVGRRIAPALDQHASHECTATGRTICQRGGAAADFSIRGTTADIVAQFIHLNLPFDRLYYYGRSRPLHVSWSVDPAGELWVLESRNGRRYPRRAVAADGLLTATPAHLARFKG